MEPIMHHVHIHNRPATIYAVPTGLIRNHLIATVHAESRSRCIVQRSVFVYMDRDWVWLCPNPAPEYAHVLREALTPLPTDTAVYARMGSYSRIAPWILRAYAEMCNEY